MRLKQWIALVVVAAAALSAGGQPGPADKAAPREALSQGEAIRQPLGRPVTVEFRVGTATMARYTADKAAEARFVFLSPFDALPGGARFEAVLGGKAVTHLDNLGLLGEDRPDRFFDGKLVRVTGVLEALGPDVARTYRVSVADLDGFEVVRLRLK